MQFNDTKGDDMNFHIVDYQATPSGYYQIAFRTDDNRTIVVTQEGRGGCNLYQPFHMKPELMEWLDQHREPCAGYLERIDFPDLANLVRNKEGEWEDTVVMGLCDMIDLGRITVEG
jgi:hypothetical protein